MTPETVMTIGQRALEITLLLSAPLLLVALVVGLLVGVFQAATQINEMTLSFIPKLIAMAAALVIAGPWMLKLIVELHARAVRKHSWARLADAATGSMITLTSGQIEAWIAPVLLAVPAHRRLPDGGADLRRPLRACANADGAAGAITLLIAPIVAGAARCSLHCPAPG